MGASLKLIDEAPAGSIVGIGGLDDLLIKTGTISSTDACPNFIKLQTISMGLVKVTIESAVEDMETLKNGLIKLNKSDPSVQFFVNKKGEFILSTCGEVHLERCIKDLNDDFCPGVELTVSEPIIEFRETIINKKLSNRIQKKQETYEELLSSSDSDEEESKTKEQMCVQELLEYEEKMNKINEQLAIEKETLKKDSALDPYLEKLVELKLM